MKFYGPVALDSVASIPWKNGGGTTRQIAVEPMDATADDFLWRISIAQIDAAGGFSAFPGIDRTILLWRGDGVTLRASAWPEHRLDDPRAPFGFRGEDDVTCELHGGATLDLNLMVRRDKARAAFEVVGSAMYTVPACDDFVLLCSAGGARVVRDASQEAVELEADQFLRVSNIGQREIVVEAQEGSLLVAISIETVL